MTPEVKFLGNGEAVIVVGEAPARATSTDGGRTITEVDQVYVARLPIEEIESDALLDERPEFDPETATWIRQGEEPTAAQARTPSGATDAEVTPARGEAQTAEQLQAEIDALVARKAELAGTPEAEPQPQT